MTLSIKILDTPTGCAAVVTDGKSVLDDTGLALHGILKWYVNGTYTSDGRVVVCADGDLVECRLCGYPIPDVSPNLIRRESMVPFAGAGITYEIDGDWTHVYGTAKAEIGSYSLRDISIDAGQYTLSSYIAGNAPDSNVTRTLLLKLGTGSQVGQAIHHTEGNNPNTFSYDGGDGFKLGIYGPIIPKGATVDFYIRYALVKGDEQAPLTDVVASTSHAHRSPLMIPVNVAPTKLSLSVGYS